MTKTQSPNPASHTKLDAELEAHISTKCKVQALPQWLNARLEARVSTTKEPYISVITALMKEQVSEIIHEPYYLISERAVHNFLIAKEEGIVKMVDGFTNDVIDTGIVKVTEREGIMCAQEAA